MRPLIPPSSSIGFQLSSWPPPTCSDPFPCPRLDETRVCFFGVLPVSENSQSGARAVLPVGVCISGSGTPSRYERNIGNPSGSHYNLCYRVPNSYPLYQCFPVLPKSSLSGQIASHWHPLFTTDVSALSMRHIAFLRVILILHTIWFLSLPVDTSRGRFYG
jgi:hypothetical protein